MAEGNGNGGSAQEASGAPSLNALGQYLKDLSFENPNAPRSLGPQEKAPNIAIQVNVNAKQLAPTDFEVAITLDAKAGEGADVLFKLDVEYAGVFRLTNIPEEQNSPDRHDRMPASAVSFRSANSRRRHPRWGLPAAVH